MPVLKNPKHERFAQELAKGKSATEAYTEAGYNGDRTAASRLSTNVNIKSRVQELQSRAADKTLVTIASLTEELEEARALALKEAQASAAVSATMGKAKLHGIGVDRHELTGKDGGPIRAEVTSARDILAGKLAGLTAGKRPPSDPGKSD